MQKDNLKNDTPTDANNVLAAVLSKLDEMIEQAQESEKIFEQHNMVSSELTSGAMAQAYKNVKQWILNGC
jgi:methanogenic corrinoid protein MtbC1